MKRIFALVLALAMLVGYLPVTHAHATEAEEPAVEETTLPVEAETDIEETTEVAEQPSEENTVPAAETEPETVEAVSADSELLENNKETIDSNMTMASSPTYASYTGVDFMNANISAQRKAALTKAMQMTYIKWTCPVDFPTWRSSKGVPNTVTATDGTSSQKFIKGKTYIGIPYSMQWHYYDDLSWYNDLANGKVTSSSMTGDYYGNGSSTAKGVDCSYFVYLAMKAANAGYVDYETTWYIKNQSKYYSEISWDDLKPADIINTNATINDSKYAHVMMFVGMVGGKYAVFEATPAKCEYNTYTKSQLTSKGYKCYRYNNFTDAPTNHLPLGHVDSVVGGAGTVTVSGWAYDRDDTNQPLEIHVYIGAPAGTAGAEGHGGIIANVYRPDVNSNPDHLGVGEYHGFEVTLNTNLTGTQKVYVYAINHGGGTNPQIGTTKTVTITPKATSTLQVHTSASSVALTMGGTNTKSFDFWFTGSHPNDYTMKAAYNKSAGYVTPTVTGPNAEGKYTITVTGAKEGTDTMTIKAIDDVSGNVITSTNVAISVTKAKYTISYNANGGSGAPAAQTKTYGQALTLSSTKPTRAGYTFLGWSTSSAATAATYAPGASFTTNANTALYAVWKAEPLGITSSVKTVELILGGTESKTITVTKTGTYTENNGRCTLQAEAMNEDVVDLAWGSISGNSAPLTITAKKEGTTVVELRVIDYDSRECLVSCSVNITVGASSYTVTYNANGGSGAPNSQPKIHGTALTLSKTVPTRFGYNFAGWATSSDATYATYQPGDEYTNNQNVTLYAVWKAPSVQAYVKQDFLMNVILSYPGVGRYIKFQPGINGKYRVYGTSDKDTKVYVYDASGNLIGSDDDSGEGTQFQLDFDVKSGGSYYIYTRFYSNTATGTLSYKIAQGYTVTYNANGGTGAPANTYKYFAINAYLSDAIPDRDGYTFLGWADSATATTAEFAPGAKYNNNEHITLYAVWQKNAYTVTYSANGGNGAPSSQSKAYGETLTIPKTIPTRFGYNFAGWATTADATSAAYQPGDTYTADADVNLYAVWNNPNTVNLFSDEYVRTADIRYPSVGEYVIVAPGFVSVVPGKVVESDYRIYGTSSKDTRVYVYDEDGNLIASDDDSGEGTQFQADLTLTGTEKHYVYVRFYGSSVTGQLNYKIANGYKITYDANGGTGAPEADIKYYGFDAALSETVPTRDGYIFLGWAESEDATSATYFPGGTITENSILRLYAVWEEDIYEEGTCGENLTWSLNRKTGVLTIYGTGKMDTFLSGNLEEEMPWYDLRSQIKTVVVGDGVTSISQCAFVECTNLTNISISESVLEIGSRAFGGCSALRNVTLPEGLTKICDNTFANCTALTEITIPSKVAFINAYAFYECDGLRSIIFTGKAPTIQLAAFYGVTATAYYPANDSSWDDVLTQELWGYLDWVCISCKNGHTEVTDAAVSPTCAENGLTAGKHCSVCDKVLVAQESIPALGHNLTSVVTAPTCTTSGYTTHACTRCRYSYTDSFVTALGHNYASKTVDPTCTTSGYTEFTCARCGDSYVDANVDPLGHDYEVVVVDPTHLTPGYTEHTCTRCGDSYRDAETAALGLPAPELTAENDEATGDPIIVWEHDGEADRYEIFRSASKTKGFSSVCITPENHFIDETASSGKTYYYKVKAICDADTTLSSDLSAAVSVKSKYPQPEAELSNSSKGYPVVKWAKVTGAKKYEVWYATGEGGTYKKLTTTSSASYTHSKASSGKGYFYKVRAYGSSSSYAGACSDAVYGVRKLSKPTITVTVNNDAGTARISWKKITGATGYELQCKVNGGEFATVATVTGTSYTCEGLQVGNIYTYRLSAKSAVEEAASNYSTEKTATIKCGKPVLTLSNDANGKPVLEWNAVPGAARYEIQYATSSKGKFKQLDIIDTTSYTHEEAVGGKTYYYKVRAMDANGIEGAYCGSKSAVCDCAAPESLTVTNSSSGYPALKWNKVTGARKYEVWYATEENGTYKKLTTTSSASYTHSKAKMDVDYFYKVRAYGSSTASTGAFSNTVRGIRILAKPSITLTTSQSGRKITVKWKKISGAMGYELQCKVNDGEFVTIDTVTGTSCVHADLAPGNKYTYRLKAVSSREAASSAYSAEKSSAIKVGKPTITVSLAETGKPQITWDAVEGAAEYQIYYATSKKGKYKLLETTKELTCIYEAAKAGKTCYFKVRAVDINGTTGDYSSIKSIKSK